MPSNTSIQRTALRAAADAERYASKGPDQMPRMNPSVLNLLRRTKRYVSFRLDIQLNSKAARSARRAGVRQLVADQMRFRGWKTLETEVAIEITIYSSQRNPPAIHSLVKNLLDYLYLPSDAGDLVDPTYLPLRNDKDVRFLSAKYIFARGAPSIHFKLLPFSSFTADLHFAFDNTEWSQPRNDFLEVESRYVEITENEAQYTKLLSEDGFKSLRALAALDLQRSITDSMRISPQTITLCYPKKSPYTKSLSDVYRNWAEALIKFPIRIQLPEIPTARDLARAYRADIETQLRQYVEKRPILVNLLAPAIVTAYYSAPRNARGFYKDVDNVMLEYLLPAFNKVFKPPISYMNLRMTQEDPNLGKVLEPVPKSLNGTAIGYEILQLPPPITDNGKGFVSVGFYLDNAEPAMIGKSMDTTLAYIKEQKWERVPNRF